MAQLMGGEVSEDDGEEDEFEGGEDEGKQMKPSALTYHHHILWDALRCTTMYFFDILLKPL